MDAQWTSRVCFIFKVTKRIWMKFDNRESVLKHIYIN